MTIENHATKAWRGSRSASMSKSSSLRVLALAVVLGACGNTAPEENAQLADPPERDVEPVAGASLPAGSVLRRLHIPSEPNPGGQIAGGPTILTRGLDDATLPPTA